jgi:hypothetical protein
MKHLPRKEIKWMQLMLYKVQNLDIADSGSITGIGIGIADSDYDS